MQYSKASFPNLLVMNWATDSSWADFPLGRRGSRKPHFAPWTQEWVGREKKGEVGEQWPTFANDEPFVCFGFAFMAWGKTPYESRVFAVRWRRRLSVLAP